MRRAALLRSTSRAGRRPAVRVATCGRCARDAACRETFNLLLTLSPRKYFLRRYRYFESARELRLKNSHVSPIIDYQDYLNKILFGREIDFLPSPSAKNVFLRFERKTNYVLFSFSDVEHTHTHEAHAILFFLCSQGTFSLIVEAYHDANNNSTDKPAGKHATLFSLFSIFFF